MRFEVLQEEIDAVTKTAGEDEEPCLGSADGDGDDASSTSSVLGLAPKCRVKTKSRPAPKSEAVKPRAKAASPKAKERKPAATPPPSFVRSLEATQSAVKQLGMIDATCLWRGAMRESEITSRMKKATDAVAELQQIAAAKPDEGGLASEAARLAEETERRVADISLFTDTVGKVKSAKQKLTGLLQDQSFADKFTKALKTESIDADTLSSVLQAVATKIANEACTGTSCFLGGLIRSHVCDVMSCRWFLRWPISLCRLCYIAVARQASHSFCG